MEDSGTPIASATSAPPRILVVEDERIVALDLAATLKELGYCVVGLSSRGEEAIRRTAELDPQLILMDVRLDGTLDGIQAAEIIRRTHDIPVIYLTAHSDNETLRRAAHANASGYLVKPFKSPELRCSIEIALHKHAAEARVKEHEQWLTTTLHSIAEAVIATDTGGYVRLFNPVAEHLTGWPEQEARQQCVADVVSLVNERSGAPLDNLLQRTLQSGAPVQTKDGTTLISRSGRKIAVEERAAPIVDSFGRVLGAVLVLRDITEQRRQLQQINRLNEELEHRVAERTAELEAANHDLEAFSYSVAHDLRAPLRAIDSFSQLLVEEHAAHLNAEGLGYLNRVRAAAVRMGRLIDALLTLAGTGRSEMRCTRFSLTALVRDLSTEVAASHPRHRVQLHIGDSSETVYGDPGLLKVAMTNLLDNAWKFTQRTANASVEFGAAVVDRTRTFFVRDNGAGFDPAYADKLFGAFQRLHSEREFAGTGIGLAIVERVVRRHGGQIWAESAPGKGATFYFTLPDPGH